MGYIYKITNLINDEVYIGQTAQTIEKRWKEHVYAAYHKRVGRQSTHLQNAIKKYGEDNFTIETIEEVPNELLNSREIYWIEYYDSCNVGYNMTLGGEGSRSLDYDLIFKLWDDGMGIKTIAKMAKCSEVQAREILKGYSNYSKKESNARGVRIFEKAVNQYDLDGNFIKKYRSSKEASRQLDISSGNILAVCKYTQKTAGGYQWRFDGDEPEKDISVGNAKKINKFDLFGNYICTYESITDAATDVGVSISSILHACQGQVETSSNYLWRYADDDFPIKYQREERHRNSIVNQYDLECNYIRSFDSVADAASYYGVSVGSIYRACAGQSKTSNNFIWRFDFDEPPIKCEKKFERTKKVYQFSMDGEYIREFDSISDAAFAVGANDVSNISNACNGKSKSACGFLWSLSKESFNIDEHKDSHKKIVNQYSIDGDFIQQFNTIKEASISVNADASSITKCCKGKLQSVKGFKWAYAN